MILKRKKQFDPDDEMKIEDDKLDFEFDDFDDEIIELVDVVEGFEEELIIEEPPETLAEDFESDFNFNLSDQASASEVEEDFFGEPPEVEEGVSLEGDIPCEELAEEPALEESDLVLDEELLEAHRELVASPDETEAFLVEELADSIEKESSEAEEMIPFLLEDEETMDLDKIEADLAEAPKSDTLDFEASADDDLELKAEVLDVLQEEPVGIPVTGTESVPALKSDESLGEDFISTEEEITFALHPALELGAAAEERTSPEQTAAEDSDMVERGHVPSLLDLEDQLQEVMVHLETKLTNHIKNQIDLQLSDIIKFAVKEELLDLKRYLHEVHERNREGES